MEKTSIVVPAGIRFISEWENLEGGYSLSNFQFPHILDKKIPGCGFTEYCINNNLDIIICSPRRILLENKFAQHKDDIFYFKNDKEEDIKVDINLLKIKKSNVVLSTPDLKSFEEFAGGSEGLSSEEVVEQLPNNDNDYNTIRKKLGEMFDYIIRRRGELKPSKIIVTYDSFRHIKEFLERYNLFNDFYVVVDESQSIFIDSRFKSTTEMEFINQLRGINKVCYVSATPMIDEYLEMLPDFSRLPYFELDWETADPNRVIKPSLKVKTTKSIITSALEEIKRYKMGDFEEAVYTDPVTKELKVVHSTEIVFYVNSVDNIISIIKQAGLLPEECNILCAKTPENDKRIRQKLGRYFSIGSVPLRGEPHKMFTFCTRTVYLGADFYSDNARTMILSDANIETLALDITLDLPQILGRQRLEENPWKNRAELHFKYLEKNNRMSKEDFDNYIKEKISYTNDLLGLMNDVSPEKKKSYIRLLKEFIGYNFYQSNYIAINSHNGTSPVPEFNTLVMISEKRAFDIQQIDYKDRFTVFNNLINLNKVSISDEGTARPRTSSSRDERSELIRNFGKVKGDFREKMRILCEGDFTDEEIHIMLSQVKIIYSNMYNVLGPEKLKALGYELYKAKLEYNKRMINLETLSRQVYNKFEVGKIYDRRITKRVLTDIYNSAGYSGTVDATEIDKFFDIKTTTVTNKETGKRDSCILLLSKKF